MCNYCGKTFFTWDHLVFLYYRTNGRISRKQYLYAILLKLAAFITLFFAIALTTYINMELIGEENMIISTLFSIAFGIVYISAFIYFIWSFYALLIKRLKDCNMSPWYIVLLFFIPFLHILFPLYLLFKKGDKGDNKYGHDPESKEKIGFLKKVKIKGRMGILP